jgi:XTP/dITP diphosphohydrolase
MSAKRAAMTRLLLSTRNRGKVRELAQLLADLPALELLCLDDVPGAPEVIEDGSTFEHNACKKAIEIARFTSMLVLSDDSGLEVDALGGLPGVHSARYAGPGASDADNSQKLVAELARRGVPMERRTARYRVVLALAEPSGPLAAAPHLAEGACEGRIRLQPSGEHGFGYDPYFEPVGYDCTMAELPPAEKNRISHRAQAVEKMRRFLARYLPGRSS